MVKCFYCPKEYGSHEGRSNHHLKTHAIQHKAHLKKLAETRQHKCTKCGKTYLTQGSLRKHSYYCTGEVVQRESEVVHDLDIEKDEVVQRPNIFKVELTEAISEVVQRKSK